jgi:hypothetical protein
MAGSKVIKNNMLDLLAIFLDFLPKIGNFSAFSTLSPDPKIKFNLVWSNFTFLLLNSSRRSF